MSTELSPELAAYFAATNAHDVAGMIATFSEEAVVKDEGREHRGLPAIRTWMKETIAKYDYSVYPIESSRVGDKTVVNLSIWGQFPGSPLPLRYEFTVASQKIARLEIG